MPEIPDQNPEDEFRDLLRQFLSGGSEIDPRELARAAGLGDDPAVVQQLLSQFQSALDLSGDGINWSLSLEQGKAVAERGRQPSLPDERDRLLQAFHIAALWLDEATSISELSVTPKLLSRTEWVVATMPVWTQLAEPVANSIADALTEVLQEQAPEDMGEMIAGASKMFRSVGGTLFAMQLGQVVGQLSTEAVSGGDIGIPLLGGTDTSEQAAILPQNAKAFGEGLDVEPEEVSIYLAVRELAHARLFRHARWLRLQVLTSITEIVRGNRINQDMMERIAENFDPTSPEALQDAVRSGELLEPRSESQLAAAARLETTLALVEGWVDVVTATATSRLPKSGAIAEMVRRRRASGGPAESAFSTLIGLELRPRRLREAAAMWQQLTDAVGEEKRDELWSHPDLIPTAEDIDDPAALIARITGPAPEPDDVDQAIADLLGDDNPDRPKE
ncbi:MULTISPECIES: zinc-dependent metalloprotease [unclassified Cryobacterium]|uniref:zinc-dependent metalloprotease n=1 Tax=unclassified Cryobacterium TaxID=2649013 RepID=UPI0014469614|nr:MULTISPECIES: zinc-dependent metalloprotease [unclassified Cryobacterium]